jgi:hypothetical protein
LADIEVTDHWFLTLATPARTRSISAKDLTSSWMTNRNHGSYSKSIAMK